MNHIVTGLAVTAAAMTMLHLVLCIVRPWAPCLCRHGWITIRPTAAPDCRHCHGRGIQPRLGVRITAHLIDQYRQRRVRARARRNWRVGP